MAPAEQSSALQFVRRVRVAAASLADSSAEALAFLRRQPRPAVWRAGPAGPPDHPETAKAPEQDPAQGHQTDRLPEPKGTQAEQLWHQPVPELQHCLTESRDSYRDQQRDFERPGDQSLRTLPGHHVLRLFLS